MLRSRKSKVFDAKFELGNMNLDVGKSRRAPHAGIDGGCMAARGDENSIIDAVGNVCIICVYSYIQNEVRQYMQVGRSNETMTEGSKTVECS